MSAAAPDSTDIVERALLGSLMLVGAVALPKVTKLLKPVAFVREKHRVIYEAILEVAKETDPDLVLVIADLDSSNQLGRAGGAAYVSGLLDDLPCVDNVVFYARHVQERAVLRKAAASSTTRDWRTRER